MQSVFSEVYVHKLKTYPLTCLWRLTESRTCRYHLADDEQRWGPDKPLLILQRLTYLVSVSPHKSALECSASELYWFKMPKQFWVTDHVCLLFYVLYWASYLTKQKHKWIPQVYISTLDSIQKQKQKPLLIKIYLFYIYLLCMFSYILLM